MHEKLILMSNYKVGFTLWNQGMHKETDIVFQSMK